MVNGCNLGIAEPLVVAITIAVAATLASFGLPSRTSPNEPCPDGYTCRTQGAYISVTKSGLASSAANVVTLPGGPRSPGSELVTALSQADTRLGSARLSSFDLLSTSTCPAELDPFLPYEASAFLRTGIVDTLVEACFLSDDYEEGRTAFMEKRTPTFQGR